MRLFAREPWRWAAVAALAILSVGWLAWQRSLRSAPAPPAWSTLDGLGGYRLFFTNPGGYASTALRGGPDAALADAIDQAQRSVDMAIYELDLWSIRDALLRAHRRGVRVRIVTDDANLANREVAQLAAEGIPVAADGDRALMHHKFVVLDASEVWTGSMNFTVRGAYRNDNNLISISSPELARSYLDEFEEMFAEHRFGQLSPAGLARSQLEVSGWGVEVLFSPEDEVEARLVELVQDAAESIHFLAFSLTSDALTRALIERQEAGVLVWGVLEASQAENLGGDFALLKRAGVQVRLDGNPANMHHKVIIIDGQIVITGSYNFSRSAEERNDENVLVIHAREVAEQYLIEFDRVWSRASD